MAAVSRCCCFLLLCCLLVISGRSDSHAAGRYKVLVVFSYAEGYQWEADIRRQIAASLESCCELTFYYLDAGTLAKQNAHRADAAFGLYEELQPDGVIAVNDAAQSLFVVPYLKDQVATPVIFCGIYASPALYGYPGRNVTGVRRHLFLEEGIAFTRQLVGGGQPFAVMTRDGYQADLILQQMVEKFPRLAEDMLTFLQPKTVEEAVLMADGFSPLVDFLVLIALDGIPDRHGRSVGYLDMIARLDAVFHKPTTSPSEYAIRAGVLSGVTVSGAEEGERAADLLLKAMRGIPVAELPITRNYRGTRMINVSTLKELEIQPAPMALRGSKLVTVP